MYSCVSKRTNPKKRAEGFKQVYSGEKSQCHPDLGKNPSAPYIAITSHVSTCFLVRVVRKLAYLPPQFLRVIRGSDVEHIVLRTTWALTVHLTPSSDSPALSESSNWEENGDYLENWSWPVIHSFLSSPIWNCRKMTGTLDNLVPDNPFL